MKNRLFTICLLVFAGIAAKAQVAVPKAVKIELERRYPDAKAPVWAKEGGNYSATWKSKLDGQTTAVFSPYGAFVDVHTPADIKFLPAGIPAYVKGHHHTVITSAEKNVSVIGKITYRVKTKAGKTLIFDQEAHCLSR